MLVCYCCGEPLGESFSLVTVSPGNVDRVFVMLDEHTVRVSDETKTVVRVSVQSERDES